MSIGLGKCSGNDEGCDGDPEMTNALFAADAHEIVAVQLTLSYKKIDICI